jgi:sugar phosphate isomerase/epimerase
MKPCMMSGSFLQIPGTTIKDMFQFSKELGIEGIDFCNTNILPVQPNELRGMCDDFGIQAVCSTVVNDVNTPGMTKEKWLDNIKRIVEDAVILQTGKIMLPTPGKPGIDKEITRQKWLDNLKEATKIGEDAGVCVSIESFAADAIWSPFISSDDILLAIKAAPKLKVTFDSGNHAIVEDPAEAFQKLAPYVIHSHFKDWEILAEKAAGSFLMPDGKYYRMTPIGEGLIDSVSCIKTMKDNGYNEFIDIEYFGGRRKPLDAIKASYKYMTEIINKS